MDIDTYIAHIQALVRSPEIAGYLVGITTSTSERRSSYLREGFELFYILTHELGLQHALEVEEALFCRLTSAKRSVLYTKYQDPKRLGPYRRSVGGTQSTDGLYSVYIAAWLRHPAL